MQIEVKGNLLWIEHDWLFVYDENVKLNIFTFIFFWTYYDPTPISKLSAYSLKHIAVDIDNQRIGFLSKKVQYSVDIP